MALNERKQLIMNAFYEGNGSIAVCNHIIEGMALVDPILEKLYRRNAKRFMNV